MIMPDLSQANVCIIEDFTNPFTHIFVSVVLFDVSVKDCHCMQSSGVIHQVHSRRQTDIHRLDPQYRYQNIDGGQFKSNA